MPFLVSTVSLLFSFLVSKVSSLVFRAHPVAFGGPRPAVFLMVSRLQSLPFFFSPLFGFSGGFWLFLLCSFILEFDGTL